MKTWYLYGLTLVHFDDMEVKTVDAFPRGQKHWFKCEVVSYIHKNLGEGEKVQSDKGVYTSHTSRAALVSVGLRINYVNTSAAMRRGSGLLSLQTHNIFHWSSSQWTHIVLVHRKTTLTPQTLKWVSQSTCRITHEYYKWIESYRVHHVCVSGVKATCLSSAMWKQQKLLSWPVPGSPGLTRPDQARTSFLPQQPAHASTAVRPLAVRNHRSSRYAIEARGQSISWEIQLSARSCATGPCCPLVPVVSVALGVLCRWGCARGQLEADRRVRVQALQDAPPPTQT